MYDREEERAEFEDQESDSTPPTLWRASANTVEATAMDEPATFQEATNGSDQLHCETRLRPNSGQCVIAEYLELPNRQLAKDTIGTNWVIKIKRKGDGSIEKYKARLASIGF
uniref:AlNc14C163G7816 protein n=1 Tax=Albugo laibachii Nc14 TaxID=890382 RepID=F0WMX9_9STRA|nr:AlNc14C163G7816 [Albugo laibachii Nc14]|eukprot:CCA22666.1 AlNc14C163G7816 [Albugo laibachii Nc14]